MEQAAALLVQSMRQSDAPMSELSDALARIARTLNDVGAPLFGESGAPPAGYPRSPKSTFELHVLRNALARDIAVCIESLQFHDRLMQQLAEVRDILSGPGASRRLARVPNVPTSEGGIEGTIELF